MNRTSLGLLIVAFVSVASVSAQVSPTYQGWGETAVQSLMMKQEKTDWAAVRSDADAKQFIEVFWARRDPTPDTPDNELRQQMEKRIAEADKRFAEGKTPGSQTQKGIVYTLLGEPVQVVNRVTRPARSATMSQFQRPINFETWIYRGEAAGRVPGTKSFDVAFVFQDDKAALIYELDGPSRLSFDSIALTMAKSVLKRPYLTVADLKPGTGTRTVALRLIVVSDAAVANEVLRRAQENENFADLARKFSTHSSSQHGGYLGRIPFAELDDDIKTALVGKKPGESFLIARKPMFAIMRLLTDAEATAADAEMAPK